MVNSVWWIRPQCSLGCQVKKFHIHMQSKKRKIKIKVKNMTFIITLWTQEGIVMASDSRLTLNTIDQQNNQAVRTSFPQSDANYKTFLAPGNIGISTFGTADIQGVPISGYIDSFIHEKIELPQVDLRGVPQLLLDYFRSLPVVPDTGFHVAGYINDNGKQIPHIWRIFVSQNMINEVIQTGQNGGAAWNGETEIMSRLLLPVSLTQNDGTNVQLPTPIVQWTFFTLQDAIDFAIYAVKVTRDTMRFLARIKTVGGPVDVLVIKPGQGSDRAVWIQRKELGGDGRTLSF
jgi:hypothetical protein